MDSNTAQDKADHTMAVPATTTDSIYQSSSKPDSEDGGEVNMVGQGDPTPMKTTEEIQWELEEEMAWAACLARELDKNEGA
jgi:hypothetical protein